MNNSLSKSQIDKKGFTIIESIFSKNEIQNLIEIIENATQNSDNFRKSENLFAIRNLLQEIPALNKILWNENLKSLIQNTFGENYFNVKAIYFDKPANSNWIVAWHQDLTISVDGRQEIEGFTNWSLKQGLQAVQPPRQVLENIYTVRIHLDDCDETNGALRVSPKSHHHGVLQVSDYERFLSEEVTCNVLAGGVMLMKPLILHASNKSISNRNRRVIHLEFSDIKLPNGLIWREKMNIF
jgi:ectoine hydroxylase-related dioxygenase (phytanoyl-CoA dioxygenase family)